MTNEEAIQYLTDACLGCEDYEKVTQECLGAAACFEARRTAIKALDQQSKTLDVLREIRQEIAEEKWSRRFGNVFEFIAGMDYASYIISKHMAEYKGEQA